MTTETLVRRRNYSIQGDGSIRIKQILLNNLGAQEGDCVWMRLGSNGPLEPYTIGYLRALRCAGYTEISARGPR